MKKRLLAMALTLAMLLSLLPAQAFATGPVINGGIHTEHNFVEVQPQQSTQTPEAEDPSAENPPLKGAQTEASSILGLLDYDAAVADLTYLSQVIGSRLAGSKSEILAQDYVAAEFQKLGYEVTRQDVPIAKNSWFSGTVGEVYVGDLTLAANTPTNNEYYTGFGQAGGTAVYLEDPADVASLGSDLSGKIVFFPGNWRSGKDPDTISAIQALDAANAEAIVALLDLSIDEAEAQQKYLPTLTFDSSMTISTPVLLCNAMEAERVPAYLAEHPGIQVTVDSRNSNTYSQNVIGLKKAAVETDWTIYVSAHIDSVIPSPGANDNGSGVVGVLAMARAFKDIETNYNIAFITVGAEEIGLVGSAYYADNLTDEEIKHAIGNYNIDMIATSYSGCDYIYMMAPTTAFSLTDNSVENRVVLSTYRAAEQLGYDMNYVTAVKDWASDHSSFNDVGIPAVGYIWSTSGTSLITEDYYHTINDSMVNGINFSVDRLKTMVDLVATAVYNDATADYVAVVGDGVNREYYTTIEEAQAAAGEGENVSLFDPHAHCVYGENCNYIKEGKACEHGTTEFATPLTNANFVSSVNVAGSYYLTEDVTLTGALTLNCGGAIYLCLNGHTIYGSQNLNMYGATKLYLCNCTRETAEDAYFYIDRGEIGDRSAAAELHLHGGTISLKNEYGMPLLEHSVLVVDGGSFIADPGTVADGEGVVYGSGVSGDMNLIFKSGYIENKGEGSAILSYGFGNITLDGDIELVNGQGAGDIMLYLWSANLGYPRITIGENFAPSEGKSYTVQLSSISVGSGEKYRITEGWDAHYHKFDSIPFESSQNYSIIEYYENDVVELYLVNKGDEELFEQHYHVKEDGRRIYYLTQLDQTTWDTMGDFSTGGYVLTGDVVIGGSSYFSKGIAADTQVDLCLNGHYFGAEGVEWQLGTGVTLRVDDCTPNDEDLGSFNWGQFWPSGSHSLIFADGKFVSHNSRRFSVATNNSFTIEGGYFTSLGATQLAIAPTDSNTDTYRIAGGSLICTTAPYVVDADIKVLYMSGSPIITGGDYDIAYYDYCKITFEEGRPLTPPQGETYVFESNKLPSVTDSVLLTSGWENAQCSDAIPFVNVQGYAVREIADANGVKELYLAVPQLTTKVVGSGTLTATDESGNAFTHGIEGTKAVLELTYADGHTLEEYVLTYWDGTQTVTQTLTPDAQGKCEVTMPAADVTVTATIEPPHKHTMSEDGHVSENDTENIDFTEKLTQATVPASGNLELGEGAYVLKSDLVLSENQSIVITDDVDLCLNGKNITFSGTGNIVYNADATLRICDCCADAPGTITSPAAALITLNGANQKLELYGGNLLATASRGECVLVNSGTVNIYGGTIVTQAYGGRDNTRVAGLRNLGGTVLVAGGSFSTTVSGTANQDAYTQCLITDGGTTTINGGTFEGYNCIRTISGILYLNDAQVFGSAIGVSACDEAVVYIKGGEIHGGGGTGLLLGDNGNPTVYVTGGKIGDEEVNYAIQCRCGTLYMNGGELVSKNMGIYMYLDATVHLTGGSINAGKNGVGYYSPSKLYMSGSPAIESGQNDIYFNNEKTPIYLTPGEFLEHPEEGGYYTVGVFNLNQYSKVQITDGWETYGLMTIPLINNQGYEIHETDFLGRRELFILPAGAMDMYPPHEHDGVKFYYPALDTELSGLGSGSCYMMNNLTGGSPYVLSDKTIHLCLNGRTFDNAGQFAFTPMDGSEIYLYDCTGNGQAEFHSIVIDGTYNGGSFTNVFSGSGNSALHLVSGTYTCTTIHEGMVNVPADYHPKPDGGVALYHSGSRFYLEGATLNLSDADSPQIMGLADGARVILVSGTINDTVGTGCISVDPNGLDLEMQGPVVLTSANNGAEILLNNGALISVTGNITPTAGETYRVKLDAAALATIQAGGIVKITDGFGTSGTEGMPFEACDAPYETFRKTVDGVTEVYIGIKPHEHDGILFETALTTIGSELTTGTYYLDAETITATGAITIPEGSTVHLCLNGKTLDMGSGVINVEGGATLHIYDCSADKTGKVTGSGNNTVVVNGDFNLYSGTIENTNGSYMTNTINANGNANLYGGSVHSVAGGAVWANSAGTVTIDSDDLTITGGEKGILVSGALVMSGSPVINGGSADIQLNSNCNINLGGTLAPKDGETYSVKLGTALSLSKPEHVFTADWTNMGHGAEEMKYFTSVNSTYAIVEENGELVLKAHIHDGILFDKSFNDEETVKAGGTPFIREGNYVLTGDHSDLVGVVFEAINAGGIINVCLCGSTLSVADGLDVWGHTIVNLFDCKDDGEWIFNNFVLTSNAHHSEAHLKGGKFLPRVNNSGNAPFYSYSVTSKLYIEGADLVGPNGYWAVVVPGVYDSGEDKMVVSISSGSITNTGNSGCIEMEKGDGVVQMEGTFTLTNQAEGGAEINIYGTGTTIEIVGPLDPPVVDGVRETYSVYLDEEVPTVDAPVQFTTGWGEHNLGKEIPFTSTQGYLVEEITKDGVTELYMVLPAVTLVYDETMGTAAAAPSGGLEGTTITVTAAPEEGYAIESITVSYFDGTQTVTTTLLPSGTEMNPVEKTFTMPAAHVTVNVNFKKLHEHYMAVDTDNGGLQPDGVTDVTEKTVFNIELDQAKLEELNYTLPAGNYVLTETIELTNNITVKNNVNLCLSSHTITFAGAAYNLHVTGGTLNICSCGGGGVENTANASNAIKVSGGHANIYGGSFKADSSGAGALSMINSGSVNIYGGSFITYKGNRSVFMNGTGSMCIYGGTFTHGTGAQQAIYVNGSTCLTVAGGNINGRIEINTSADNVISGGTITHASGNAVSVTGNGKLTVTGGTIEGNGVKNNGIDNSGILTVTGGTIDGGNYGVNNNGTFNLSGTPTITGDTADIYLAQDKVITVAAALIGNDTYSVLTAEKPEDGKPVQITTGWATYGEGVAAEDYPFTSAEYVVQKLSEPVANELYLVLPKVVTETDGNGTLTMTSPAAADVRVGSTITLTATPDEGYKVGTVTVTYKDASGKDVTVPVTENGNGTYTFTMPNTALVTAYATFKEIHKHQMSVECEETGTLVTFDRVLSSDADLASYLSNEGVLPAGNYVLMADEISSNTQIKITEGTVNLCLNGKTLHLGTNYSDYIYVAPGATLNICDCSREDPEGALGQGKISRVNAAPANEGELEGHEISRHYGIWSEGSLNIYGGTYYVEGNKDISTLYIETTDTQKPAVLNLFSGLVVANAPTGGEEACHILGIQAFNSGTVVNQYNDARVEARGYANDSTITAAVYLYNYAIYHLYDGEIYGTSTGGNFIYGVFCTAPGSEFHMYDGLVKAEKENAPQNISGRVRGISSYGKVYCSGGRVESDCIGVTVFGEKDGDGHYLEVSGDAYVEGSYCGIYNVGNTTVTGGTVTGSAYGVYHQGSKFNLSGSPIITGNDIADIYLTLDSNGSNRVITVTGELGETVEVEGVKERKFADLYYVLTANTLSASTNPIRITQDWGKYPGGYGGYHDYDPEKGMENHPFRSKAEYHVFVLPADGMAEVDHQQEEVYFAIPVLEDALTLYLQEGQTAVLSQAEMLRVLVNCDPDHKVFAKDVTFVLESVLFGEAGKNVGLTAQEYSDSNGGKHGYRFYAATAGTDNGIITIQYYGPDNIRCIVYVKLTVQVYRVLDSVLVLDYGHGADLTGIKSYAKDILPGTLEGGCEAEEINTALTLEALSEDAPVYAVNEETFSQTMTLTEGDGKGDWGDFTITDGKLIYTPNAMKDVTDEMYLTFRAGKIGTSVSKTRKDSVTELQIDPTQEVELFKKITVLPANVVYYDDTSVAINWSEDTDIEITTVGQSSVGYQDAGNSDEYGNDSDYADAPDTYTGSGGTYRDILINGAGTILTFTFTGTGFDLVGSTNATSGSMECLVYEGTKDSPDEKPLYSWLVDTMYRDGEIHEAPLLHKEMAHGTYTVEINAVPEYDWDYEGEWEYNEDLDWYLPPIKTAHLRLDGVRIYNPLSMEDDNRQYYNEGEKDAQFVQLRNLILKNMAASASFSDAEEFTFGSGNVFYLETSPNGMSYTGNMTSDVNDYLVAGPNNEVYFNSATQSVVFYVRETGTGKGMLQIGVRNLNPKALGGTGDAVTAPGLILIGEGGATMETLVSNTKAIGYTEQYYTVDYTKCVKETINEVEYYRVVLSSDSAYPFSMSNVKYSGLEFAVIPEETSTLIYDEEGILVEEVNHNMPNLQSLVWQLRAAYDMLPEDSLEEAVDESMKFMAVSLTLHSSIGMKIYVKEEVLEGYDDPYVLIEKMYGDKVIYETAKLDPTANVTAGGYDCKVFYYTDLSSKEMSATVRMTLYGTKDGELTRGEIRDYGILTYAKNTLQKTTDENLKTLLVDMLNYGAQAQDYFDYHEEFLANSTLTEEEKAYATVTEPELSSALIPDDPKIPGSGSYGFSIAGASLVLKDKVELNFFITVKEGSLEGKKMVIIYEDAAGNAVKTEIGSESFVLDKSGLYKVNFDGLRAKDMRVPVTCWVEDEAGERMSNALTYSIESYAASKVSNETLKPLLLDMMRYGDSAQNYFNPQKSN